MSAPPGQQPDDTDASERSAERAELHFLAALTDELMRALLTSGVLTQAQLNEIEAETAKKIGSIPRAW